MSTLLELRTQVRYNLGEPNPGIEPRFQNTSINDNINEAYLQYQLELIENGEGDLATTQSINLVANTDLYPLPSDWVKTKTLWRVRIEGRYPLEKRENRTEPIYTNSYSSASDYKPTYRFRNRNILLEPPPAFAETGGLLHEYYALSPKLTADNQSPVAGFIEPWQTMLVLYATVAQLENKDAVGGVSDISSFRARLERAEKRFRDSMNRRTESIDYVRPDDF